MFKKIILFISLICSLRVYSVPYEGSKILIVGSSSLANLAGQEVAKRGGNVFDVAVTVGLVMTVTNPHNASFGGGGFALLSTKDKVEVLDFRERAPAATHEKYYLNKPKKASTLGGTAVGVPGVAAGLWAIHSKYGKLKWKTLFRRALEYAKNGVQVSGYIANRIQSSSKNFNEESKNVFLKKDKTFYKPGDILVQNRLFSVLKKYQQFGPKAFYEGKIAEDIVNTVKAEKGHLDLVDLKEYSVRWLKPLKAKFKGYDVYLMPPPSSGGYVIKTALGLADHVKPEQYGALSVNELHFLGEIFKASFRGRSLLGDPDYHANPFNMLFSDEYLSQLKSKINLKKISSFKPLLDKKYKESKETTHFNVMDKQGNAVSLTVTLNGTFGSGVTTKKFGITLNNEMDDFTTRPGQANMFGLVQGMGNAVQAGKRPLSSMSPTIVKKGKQVLMSLGAPGGPRIISGVFQVLYRVLVSNFNVDEAIQAPRVHHQFLPDTLFIDKHKHSPDVLKALAKKGHKIKSGWMGRVNAIYLNHKNNLEASFDARGEGSVAGY
ncbi:MAG: gamma-glutamyltransferase [Bdellovibrionaceae bacterium]|nr:gamma-glutamyltransferase [Pseudobdellovibrionaceae bacterium]